MSQSAEEDRVNALVLEIRVLESTYNELTSRQSLLERALIENRAALEALKGLSEHPSDEILTQIGAGAMLRSQPPATDKVLIGVGSSVVIEKPRAEAVAVLEGRSRDVEKTLVSVIGQRNEIAERLEADRQVLNVILSRQSQ